MAKIKNKNVDSQRTAVSMQTAAAILQEDSTYCLVEHALSTMDKKPGSRIRKKKIGGAILNCCNSKRYVRVSYSKPPLRGLNSITIISVR